MLLNTNFMLQNYLKLNLVSFLEYPANNSNSHCLSVSSASKKEFLYCTILRFHVAAYSSVCVYIVFVHLVRPLQCTTVRAVRHTSPAPRRTRSINSTTTKRCVAFDPTARVILRQNYVRRVLCAVFKFKFRTRLPCPVFSFYSSMFTFP